MPSPIAHALVGATVVAAAHKAGGLPQTWRALLLGAALAVSPDLDRLVRMLGGAAVHRTASHSLACAVLVGCVAAAVLGRGRLREAVAYGLAFGSHAVLDVAASEQARGVMLLWPLSGERYRLGVWGFSEFPLRQGPAGVLRVVLVECAIFVPVLCGVVGVRWWQTSRRCGGAGHAI
jgi:membrane-bound metal-dependent hydrolase YbcI (DUF457 family)